VRRVDKRAQPPSELLTVRVRYSNPCARRVILIHPRNYSFFLGATLVSNDLRGSIGPSTKHGPKLNCSVTDHAMTPGPAPAIVAP
jgi:hypothetical protein